MRLFFGLSYLIFSLNFISGKALDLDFPTQNRHLLSKEWDQFYTPVERNFEGVRSMPWQSGTFGFVRNPLRLGDQVIYTRFHEGVDIKPLKRDAKGQPLDRVRAIAQGKIIHISTTVEHSNYGKYVVIEHEWSNSKVYSLYAHLAEVSCQLGQVIQKGEDLGLLGFTGSGINCARAHLHVEVNLLLNEHFTTWHQKHFKTPNYHGNFNGMNLIGLDFAALILAFQQNSELTLPQFVATIPAYFKVAFPAEKAEGFSVFLKRYPWLLKNKPASENRSWDVTFSATGFPLAIEYSNRTVTKPTVVQVRNSLIPHGYLTRGLVQGTGSDARLGSSGLKLIELITQSLAL